MTSHSIIERARSASDLVLANQIILLGGAAALFSAALVLSGSEFVGSLIASGTTLAVCLAVAVIIARFSPLVPVNYVTWVMHLNLKRAPPLLRTMEV
jgi:hypothetical protein